jgi:hypothetical protein
VTDGTWYAYHRVIADTPEEAEAKARPLVTQTIVTLLKVIELAPIAPGIRYWNVGFVIEPPAGVSVAVERRVTPNN